MVSAVGCLFLLAKYIHAAGVANTSIYADELVCAGSIMFLLADLFLLVVTCFGCLNLVSAVLSLILLVGWSLPLENRRRKYFTYLKELLPHVYREDLLLLRRRMNRWEQCYSTNDASNETRTMVKDQVPIILDAATFSIKNGVFDFDVLPQFKQIGHLLS
ncbi:hypothetical protein Tco_1020918 [Tanacetum coccineum]